MTDASPEKTPLQPLVAHLGQIRRAVADLLDSDGYGCCRDDEDYNKSKSVLADLLGIPKRESGEWDFEQFETPWREKS